MLYSVERQPRAGYTIYDYACRYKACSAGGLTTNAAKLDTDLWEIVRGAVMMSDWLFQQADEWAARSTIRSEQAATDVGALGRQLKELERKQDNLTADIEVEDNAEVRAILRHRLAEVVEQHRRIATWQEQAKEQAAAVTERAERMKAKLAWLNDQQVRLQRDDFTYQEKRDLLADLDARVIVWRASHTPRWLLLFGWTAYLIERVDNPAALPVPIGPVFPEVEAAADQEVQAQFAAAVTAPKGSQEYWEQVAKWAAQVFADPATYRRRTHFLSDYVRDPLQFAAALAPAADWAESWLSRPRKAKPWAQLGNMELVMRAAM